MIRLRLSEHKILKGLTWIELSEATGVPRDHLIAMDRGYARSLDVRYIPALARFFDIDCGDLVEGEVVLPIKTARPKRRNVQT